MEKTKREGDLFRWRLRERDGVFPRGASASGAGQSVLPPRVKGHCPSAGNAGRFPSTGNAGRFPSTSEAGRFPSSSATWDSSAGDACVCALGEH